MQNTITIIAHVCRWQRGLALSIRNYLDSKVHRSHYMFKCSISCSLLLNLEFMIIKAPRSPPGANEQSYRYDFLLFRETVDPALGRSPAAGGCCQLPSNVFITIFVLWSVQYNHVGAGTPGYARTAHCGPCTQRADERRPQR